MSAGKGDSPRPLSVSRAEFARRWNRAFRERICTLCEQYFTETDAPAGFDICADCWARQVDSEMRDNPDWDGINQCYRCGETDMMEDTGLCSACFQARENL